MTARKTGEVGLRMVHPAVPLWIRLARGLIRRRPLGMRQLRALEYLIFRLFTRPAQHGTGVWLKPEEKIDELIAECGLNDSHPSSERTLQQYLELTERALEARSYEALRHADILGNLRKLKYEIGSRFVDRDVIKASLQALLIVQMLGVSGGAGWKGDRLPIEPVPEGAPTRVRQRKTVSRPIPVLTTAEVLRNSTLAALSGERRKSPRNRTGGSREEPLPIEAVPFDVVGGLPDEGAETTGERSRRRSGRRRTAETSSRRRVHSLEQEHARLFDESGLETRVAAPEPDGSALPFDAGSTDDTQPEPLTQGVVSAALSPDDRETNQDRSDGEAAGGGLEVEAPSSSATLDRLLREAAPQIESFLGAFPFGAETPSRELDPDAPFDVEEEPESSDRALPFEDESVVHRADRDLPFENEAASRREKRARPFADETESGREERARPFVDETDSGREERARPFVDEAESGREERALPFEDEAESRGEVRARPLDEERTPTPVDRSPPFDTSSTSSQERALPFEAPETPSSASRGRDSGEAGRVRPRPPLPAAERFRKEPGPRTITDTGARVRRPQADRAPQETPGRARDATPPRGTRTSSRNERAVAARSVQPSSRLWNRLTALNLVLLAMLGIYHLATPSMAEVDASGRYQSFRLAGAAAQLPLESARRLDDLLILTASDRWLELDETAREDLVRYLARSLIGRESIERLVVLDPNGRRLAFATRSSIELARGAR